MKEPKPVPASQRLHSKKKKKKKKTMPSFARPAAVLALVAAAASIDRSSAFALSRPAAAPHCFAPPASSTYVHSSRRNVVVLHMSTATAAPSGTRSIAPPSGALPLALKKPSKTLTVCLEYDASADDNASDVTSSDIATLSMQLRKVKAGAIFTTDIAALAEFAQEQESARGDFPGPCPVVYCGTVDGIADAVSAGASAVVLGPDSIDKAADIKGADVIWEVKSVDDVEAVLAVQEAADSFLVGGDDIEATIAALPGKTSCAIGTVQAMQDDEAEITEGRNLKKAGCASVFIRRAIVGDAEDLGYAQFAIGGLTSKASSEFNFSGLTGSANGHFGGIASAGKGNKWKRNMSLDMVANSAFGNALEEIEETEDIEESQERKETMASAEETKMEDDDEEVKEEEPEILASAEEDVEEEVEKSDKEATSEPELIEALKDVESEPAPEPVVEPEPELVSKLSDAAKYFLSSSGLRKNIPEAEAKNAASTVKDREDAARRELEPRIERLGIGADEEEDA